MFLLGLLRIDSECRLTKMRRDDKEYSCDKLRDDTREASLVPERFDRAMTKVSDESNTAQLQQCTCGRPAHRLNGEIKEGRPPCATIGCTSLSS